MGGNSFFGQESLSTLTSSLQRSLNLHGANDFIPSPFKHEFHLSPLSCKKDLIYRTATCLPHFDHLSLHPSRNRLTTSIQDFSIHHLPPLLMLYLDYNIYINLYMPCATYDNSCISIGVSSNNKLITYS